MTPPKNETPEQRRQRLDKNNAKRRKKESEETAEQKRQRLDKANADRAKREAVETPGQKRERITRITENRRSRDRQETAQKREDRLNKMKRWRAKHKPHETQEQKQKRADKRKIRRGTLEAREKQKFYRLMRSVTMTEEEKEEQRQRMYFYRQANKGRWSWANLTQAQRERHVERNKLWVQSVTGEKKQRHLENVARALKKSEKKRFEKLKQDPVKWQQYKQKMSEYQKRRYANETQEQRQRRIRKDTINHAKRRLKVKLEEENASPEETELQLRELGERMWREYYPDEDVPLPMPARTGRRRRVETAIPETVGEIPLANIQLTVTPDEGLVLINADQSFEHYVWSEFSTHSPSSSPPVETDAFDQEVDSTASTTEGQLPCRHCSFTVSTTEDLRSHLLSCHSEKSWKCPKCQALMISPVDLSQHYSSFHTDVLPQNYAKEIPSSAGVADEWKFLCMKCSPELLQRFRTREDLLIHVQQQHVSNYWPCPDCQLLKYTENALNLHQIICHSAPTSS